MFSVSLAAMSIFASNAFYATYETPSGDLIEASVIVEEGYCGDKGHLEYFGIGRFSSNRRAEPTFVSDLKISWNGRIVPLPASAVLGLALPKSVEVTGTSENLRVELTGSSGSGGWTATYHFEQDNLRQRILRDNIAPDEIVEVTTYSSAEFD